MVRRLRIIAALFCLPLALASCKINTINSFPTTFATVRFVNVMTDAGALDAVEGGATQWAAVAPETGTGYKEFPPSNVNFSVNVPGSTSSVVNASYTLFGEQPYTLIAYGSLRSPALVMMPDDTVAPGSGNFRLRIANAAAGIGFIDAYLTQPTDVLDNLSPNFTVIDTGAVTISNRFASGQYRLRLTLSGSKTVIYDSGTVIFADGRDTAAIMYNKGSGLLVNVVLADFGGTSAVGPANSTLARVKSIHAAPQTAAVDMLVDSVGIVTGEVFPSPSSYLAIAPGSRAITFEATATPGAAIAFVPAVIGPASDSSVLLTGLPGALHALVLADDNVPSTDQRPRVRFVNASPDAPPLDVLNGTTKQVSALASATASGYVAFDSGTYTFTVNNAATAATLLTITSVGLSSNQTVTIYLVGTAAQLAPMVVVDR